MREHSHKESTNLSRSAVVRKTRPASPTFKGIVTESVDATVAELTSSGRVLNAKIHFDGFVDITVRL